MFRSCPDPPPPASHGCVPVDTPLIRNARRVATLMLDDPSAAEKRVEEFTLQVMVDCTWLDKYHLPDEVCISSPFGDCWSVKLEGGYAKLHR